MDTDEHPKPDSTIEKLSKLPPVFKKNGVVNAGNASVCYTTRMLYSSIYKSQSHSGGMPQKQNICHKFYMVSSCFRR